MKTGKTPFAGIVSSCFEPHLKIYVESQVSSLLLGNLVPLLPFCTIFKAISKFLQRHINLICQSSLSP